MLESRLCAHAKTEATSQSSSALFFLHSPYRIIDIIASVTFLQYMAFCCHTGLGKMYELIKGLKIEKKKNKTEKRKKNRLKHLAA